MHPKYKYNINDVQIFIKAKEEEYGLKISLIDDDDAEFICILRNSFKARYLNSSICDINKQKDWIREYKIREKQELEFYFIFWSGSIQIGTIRFIKMDESNFESGSWLFIDNIPFSISVKAELFCKYFAFEHYNFNNCYFYMNKKNIQVIRYHNLFNPVLIKEDINHLYFSLSKEAYFLNKSKILSFCR